NADTANTGGDAGVVGTGGDRDSLTYFEGGPLAISGTNIGVLQNAGVCVRQKRVKRSPRDADSKVVGIQMGKRVEGEVGGSVTRSTAGSSTAGSACARSRLRRKAYRLRQSKSELSYFVPIDFEDGDIYNHLGTGTIEIIEQLLG